MIKFSKNEKDYLWMAWFIPLFMMLDIGLTLVNVNYYMEVNPEATYEEFEMNRIVTFFWNKLGIYFGTVILFSIYISFAIWMSRKFYKQELPLVWCVIVWGAYFMVIYNHINWLLYLRGVI